MLEIGEYNLNNGMTCVIERVSQKTCKGYAYNNEEKYYGFWCKETGMLVDHHYDSENTIYNYSIKMKYNYKDHFEMLYLRHDYIKSCGELDGKYIKKYTGIINKTSYIMFDKLRRSFNRVGFEIDDIKSISSLYAALYMKMDSIQCNEAALDRYVKSYKARFGKDTYPSSDELDREDRNHLIKFLRQKLLHCVTICDRKSRNIVIGRDKTQYFAYTEDSKSASNEEIISNYKALGYRKVTKQEFKNARKAAMENGTKELYSEEGHNIFEIEIIAAGVKQEDYDMISNKNNRSPEEMLLEIEEERNISLCLREFRELDEENKRKTLVEFVYKNKNNKYLRKELRLARKMLGSEEVIVLLDSEEPEESPSKVI